MINQMIESCYHIERTSFLSFKPFLCFAVKALQKLKSSLGLPLRFGWNGDPCVPEQHPWSGVDCQYDRNISKHVIDGLYVLDLYQYCLHEQVYVESSFLYQKSKTF